MGLTTTITVVGVLNGPVKESSLFKSLPKSLFTKIHLDAGVFHRKKDYKQRTSDYTYLLLKFLKKYVDRSLLSVHCLFNHASNMSSNLLQEISSHLLLKIYRD